MTWPARAAQFFRRFGSRNLAPPARTVPPVMPAFHIKPPLQPNNTAKGMRGVRRVCASMHQKQYTLNGWNYANRFRS